MDEQLSPFGRRVMYRKQKYKCKLNKYKQKPGLLRRAGRVPGAGEVQRVCRGRQLRAGRRGGGDLAVPEEPGECRIVLQKVPSEGS